MNANPSERCFLAAGVLLDDLLVSEDLAETSVAGLHSGSSLSGNSVHGSSLLMTTNPTENFTEGRLVKPSDECVDGCSVMMGSPVAAPLNGDISMDISTENAFVHGHR